MENTRNVPPTDILLNERELAFRQKRSVKTLQNDRLTGRGVPFVKAGRSVRYRLSDVLDFEKANLHHSTSDQGATPARSASSKRGEGRS